MQGELARFDTLFTLLFCWFKSYWTSYKVMNDLWRLVKLPQRKGV